ncbi:putative reverse transcriptase domain-containing protein [Tanacetum coccineum]
MEETLSKFMSESAKIHKENSNMIKEIQASTDAAVRNQRASIKALEIQIGKKSKVLQERGFGSLPSSTEANPRDHVKSISTNVKANSNPIRRASVGVMPLSIHLNLGLGELAHTKLTVELADMTVKYTKRIAENVLVGIGKFVFPVDFIILDMPEDVKVPLILRRPFLSTAHAKIDVFKRKITLRKDQVDDLIPTIEEGEFYNSIIRDKVENKGKNVVRAFMNVPIFVEIFSVVTRFVVVENMDGYQDQDMGDITLGEPFCKPSCVEARRFDGLITIHNGCDNVTYQMVRSHPVFKHLSNAQCNKIKLLLKDLAAKKSTKLVKYRSSEIMCVL